ncbi:HK97 family phage prohead protease [Empedobacter falsenii]
MKKTRFILNNDTSINSYGFRILTAGINLTRFKQNPVMLDQHLNTTSAVIGRWLDLSATETELSASPEFDEGDPHAVSISGKVERGLLNACSMGISFNKKDLKLIDGQLTLTKCELLEVSIVAIPSNPQALRLTCDGKLLTTHEAKELCLSVASTTEDFKTPEQQQSNKMKLKTLTLSILGGLGITNDEITDADIDKAILSLSNKNEQLTKELGLEKDKVNAYETKETEAKKLAADQMVDLAVKAGKITADKADEYKQFAYEKFDLAKASLDAIPAKKNFSAALVDKGTEGVKTMEDFQKLTTEQQLSIRDNQPELYNEILKSI